MFVHLFYASFWGVGGVRDLVISALITLGLFLAGPLTAFLRRVNKDRLSLSTVARIAIVGIIICAGYVAYTNNRENKLIAAARPGDTDSVAKLLKQGADVNGTLDGYTPIMIAVIKGKKETAVLLAEQGARLDGVVDNPNSNDRWLNPIGLAVKYNRLCMVGALVPDRNNEQARLQQVNDALFVAVRMDNWDAVRRLLDRGGNVNARDNENATLLMKAATEDREDAVQDLLRRGADPILRDNHARSALMYAAAHSTKSSIYRALLRQGANAMGRDDAGLTAREQLVRKMELGQWKNAWETEKPNEFGEIIGILKQAEDEQKAREKP